MQEMRDMGREGTDSELFFHAYRSVVSRYLQAEQDKRMAAQRAEEERTQRLAEMIQRLTFRRKGRGR